MKGKEGVDGFAIVFVKVNRCCFVMSVKIYVMIDIRKSEAGEGRTVKDNCCTLDCTYLCTDSCQ
jgi:hypothetical protein